MNITQEDPIKVAPIIFEIVKHAFTRDFDKIPNTLDEVIDYIQDSQVYVAYLDNIPAGYFVLKDLSEDKKELKSIAVHSDYQENGVGKTMMKKVLELCANSEIVLVTHPKNIQALVMYLKNGFVITGWIDDFLGDGQPRLKLIRESDSNTP
jgi:ribosomal protein S18 acetylase RimI-like enzyme